MPPAVDPASLRFWKAKPATFVVIGRLPISEPPISEPSPEQLYLVTIEARPAPGSETFGKMGGSFVNCWVDADVLHAAGRRAVAFIQADGWMPHRFEEWSIVTRETYTDWEPQGDDGPDLREVFEQALIDGEVCLFNTWPVNAPDADGEA